MLRKRPFGNTGWEVTEIALGGIPLIRVEFDKAVKIIHRALDKGINLIDTARAYKDSEAKFGEVMKTRREEVFLCTKTVSQTREEALRDLEVSLKELKTDYVDLWQLHDVSTRQKYERMMGPGGALEALKWARDKGKCRFIGLSGHNNELLEEAIETGEFDSVLCVYNLGVTDTNDRVLPLAKERGMATMAMKPLAGGTLFRLTKDKRTPITPEIAWRFVLMNDNLDTRLLGAAYLRDVEEAVRIARRFRPLTKRQVQKYTEMAREVARDVCYNCRYCDSCPQGIPIPQIMQLLDHARVYSYEWPKHRKAYQKLKVKADACTECGRCEELCPFNINIIERLKRAHERFNRPV